MRVYLTGADGMLGTALAAALRESQETAGWPVLGVSLADFEIGDAAAVRASITAFRPDAVVHMAANAIVDDCESHPKRALRVNVTGVRNVADACRLTGTRLIYVSSDYVFDGADTPAGGYRESHIPSPLSVYGLTKLAGERITALLDNHLLVRTSWLFGGTDERTDTVLATMRQAARGERPILIADQFGLPTYTVDLAGALIFLLTRQRLTGTVHAANAGTTSWYEVGRYIIAEFERDRADSLMPEPVPLDTCAFLGSRPRDSTLNTDLLAGLGYTMPGWQDAVRRFRARLDLAALRSAQLLGRPR